MTQIIGFTGQYDFLSTRYVSKFNLGGITWNTVEQAYHAIKNDDNECRQQLSRMRNATKIFEYGHKVPLRPNWDNIKQNYMYTVLRAKFNTNVQLADELIATGDATLIYENDWNDTFWGTVNGKGHNMYGKSLMQLRSWYNFYQTVLSSEPVQETALDRLRHPKHT